MKRIFFPALLALAIIVPGCSDDEEDKGSFKVTLDGTEKEVSVSRATLTISDGQTSSSGRGSHVLRIAGMIDDDSISIFISNWDFQEPPDNALLVKDYYNIFFYDELEVGEKTETCMKTSVNSMACEGTEVKYLRGDKLFSSNSSEAVVISLTKCDGKRVSGTFDITLINPYDEADKLVINGSLTDLRYTVKR